MTKKKLVLMLMLGGGLLAACNDNASDSVRGFTVREIISSTCESNVPKEINDTNFSGDEDADTFDVNSTQPACESSGG